MFLITLLYMFLASTYTLGEAVLAYVHPFFLVAVRMTFGGMLLLGYQYFFNYGQIRLKRAHWGLFGQIVMFHVFFSFMLEFWAMQYISGAKACLLYSLSPFITALFSYFLFKERLTIKQKIGLTIGFVGFLPVLMVQAPAEASLGGFAFISLPEIMQFLSVIAASYGWIVMKKLVIDHGYSVITVNGVGMAGGGILAFMISLLWSGLPVVEPLTVPTGVATTYLVETLGSQGAGIAMFCWYTLLLILVANIIFFNLYGLLLKVYSATFLSFAGFTTPLFAALFGWFFLGKLPSWHFFVTVLFVMGGGSISFIRMSCGFLRTDKKR